ncbi:MAG TPA: hypothetical protein DF774_16605 [Rheinheimera sp.]|nr:hypothetical protein [Rheinheimera sp.]
MECSAITTNACCSCRRPVKHLTLSTKRLSAQQATAISVEKFAANHSFAGQTKKAAPAKVNRLPAKDQM